MFDFARVDLGQQRHVLLVNRWSKQLLVKGGMTKALLEPVAPMVRSLRVDLGRRDFLWGGGVVAEGRNEDAVDVDLEDHDEENGRNGGHPDECHEALLEADGEDHEGLHEQDAEQESVDHDIPETL
jgi:hypothetical protein